MHKHQQRRRHAVVTAIAAICWIMQAGPARCFLSETAIPYEPSQELKEGLQAFATTFRRHDLTDQKGYSCVTDSNPERAKGPVPCMAAVECGYLVISLEKEKPTFVSYGSDFGWSRPHCTEDFFVAQVASVINNILGFEQLAADSKAAEFRAHASRRIARQHRNGFGPEEKIEAIGDILPLADGRGHMSMTRADIDQAMVSRTFVWGSAGQIDFIDKWMEKIK